MGRIQDIDKNFIIQAPDGRDYTYYNALEKPFELSGFAWYEKEKVLCRLPQEILPRTNDGVKTLAWYTSGGMIRFRTSSSSIAVKTELYSDYYMTHMPNSGSCGFDLYIGEGKNKIFKSNKMADYLKKDFNALFTDLESTEERECTIYMPLYNGVNKLFIGVLSGSEIKAPSPFTIEKPVLFYGSSITQGGCASRPGNSYTHILTRWLDANMINLGFSGSGRGEIAVAEAIASIPLSAFVMDYDYNAPNVEHLEKTHEKFFLTIREKQPGLPVVFVSKPDIENNKWESSVARRDVIKKTYNNALKRGDKNVHFVDGETLFGKKHRDSCTVDGVHPNDFGFMRMAENIFPALKKALGQ